MIPVYFVDLLNVDSLSQYESSKFEFLIYIAFF